MKAFRVVQGKLIIDYGTEAYTMRDSWEMEIFLAYYIVLSFPFFRNYNIIKA